jgi:hypothetical protein
VETFFHDVQLVIHLEGDGLGIGAHDSDPKPSLHSLDLPVPPRVWGPRKRDRLFLPHAYLSSPALGYRPSIRRSMSWGNTGSVTLQFDIGDLRPRETYRCDDSDVILVVSDPAHAPVRAVPGRSPPATTTVSMRASSSCRSAPRSA